MLIRFGYDITITISQPTHMVCLLSSHPDRAKDIRSAEKIVTQPPVPTTLYTDLFGNTCRRFTAPTGQFSIWGDGVLEDSGLKDGIFPDAQEVPVTELPDDCLIYLMGSRYCETDRLGEFAWSTFGQLPPGWNRVQAVCDFANKHIVFGYMNARSTRTAHDVFQERIGVCRDYAHLAITLLRCLNIPARYVNGYLGDIGVPIVDPQDFSAWIEVYLGGRWHISIRETMYRGLEESSLPAGLMLPMSR